MREFHLDYGSFTSTAQPVTFPPGRLARGRALGCSPKERLTSRRGFCNDGVVLKKPGQVAQRVLLHLHDVDGRWGSRSVAASKLSVTYVHNLPCGRRV